MKAVSEDGGLEHKTPYLSAWFERVMAMVKGPASSVNPDALLFCIYLLLIYAAILKWEVSKNQVANLMIRKPVFN